MKLGAASTALLSVGGGAIAAWQPGMADGHLSPGARGIFLTLGRAILDGAITAGQAPSVLDAMVQRVDALVAALPPHAQAELSQLLALLGTAPGRKLLAGLDTPWEKATVQEVQHALQAMRFSRVSLRQQAYLALHDIVSGAYFSEPSTWALLGYPGPLAI